MSTDPTSTTTQRRGWAAEFRGRWRDLRGETRDEVKAVILDDFSSDAAKQDEFRRWFDRRANELVLEQTAPSQYRSGRHWTGGRVRDAYDSGLRNAASALTSAGFASGTVSSAVSAGARAHKEARESGYVQAYNDAQDVIDATTSAVSSEFAEAVRNEVGGSSAVSLVNDRVKKVGQTRTNVLANTVPVREANRAALQSYELAGVENVTAKPEPVYWETAGDEKVCAECRAMSGSTFPLAAVKSGSSPRPPLHPRCRCFLAPA